MQQALRSAESIKKAHRKELLEMHRRRADVQARLKEVRTSVLLRPPASLLARGQASFVAGNTLPFSRLYPSSPSPYYFSFSILCLLVPCRAFGVQAEQQYRTEEAHRKDMEEAHALLCDVDSLCASSGGGFGHFASDHHHHPSTIHHPSIHHPSTSPHHHDPCRR